MLRLSNYALEKIQKTVDTTFVSNSCSKTFSEIGERLLRKGFKEDEVLSMLEDLYHAVADRYGD